MSGTRGDAPTQRHAGHAGCVCHAIDTARVLAAVGDVDAGGNVLFVGTARGTTDGAVTHALNYDAHEPLAVATLDALRALPGIGEWTAQVIAMRALGWPDAWPATDIGLMNALGTRDPKEVARRAEPWRPWRAYAVMQLWHQLETHP